MRKGMKSLGIVIMSIWMLGIIGCEQQIDYTDNSVITIAGNETSGFLDGKGSDAQFNWPIGIVIDDQDNIIVADAWNHRIRRIDPQGHVTTIAGSGEKGFKEGKGLEAQFDWPTGVAVDGNGTIFVADNNNHRIRKIDASGEVTTLAGGTQGNQDGTGENAEFFSPHSLVMDSNGNIVVADAWNHRIRLIDPQGKVTTLAGSGERGFKDGTGLSAMFYWPSHIAIDSKDTIIVSDTMNSRIRKIDRQGRVTTIAGGHKPGMKNGKGKEAQFNEPNGIVIDRNGTIIVADSYNYQIRKIDRKGNVTTLAGNGQEGSLDGKGQDAMFKWPSGIAIDSKGDIVISEANGNQIRKIEIKK